MRGVVSFLPNFFALCSLFLLELRSDFSDKNTLLLEKNLGNYLALMEDAMLVCKTTDGREGKDQGGGVEAIV